MNSPRNSAKGIITKNDSILLIKFCTSSDSWYTLPGGGQNTFENLHAALIREVKEETGIEITINKIFQIREYIGKNHEISEYDKDLHAVEFMFLCEALSDQIQPTIPDKNQQDVEWIKLSDLDRINLYPKSLTKILSSYFLENKLPGDVYMGDVN